MRGGMFIRINLRERRLYLYQGDNLHGNYKIAIGKPSTPSPVGNWTIANKAVLPGGTVYGTRWMGLSKPTYGIHGNNNPNSIGKAVSLGCIRMYNHEVESIFPIIPLGTEVEIISGQTGDYYTPPANTPAVPNPSSPITSPVLPGSRTYVVKQGDTLWSIAAKYNIKLVDLLAANPHLNPDLIYPGQTIILP